MYKVIRLIIIIIWILDVTNMPFMEIMDITYPFNGLAWFLVWALIIGEEE